MVVGISKKKKGKGVLTSTYGNSRSSSSHHVHHSYLITTATGHRKILHKALNSTTIQTRQEFEHEQQWVRMDTMSSTELQELEAIHIGEDPLNGSWESEHQLDINDILSGETMADISHAGGKFMDLLEMGDDWVEAK